LRIENRQTGEVPYSEPNEVERPTGKRALIQIGGLLALALISIFLLAKIAVSTDLIGPMKDSLDSQQSSAVTMASSAAGLSIVLAAVPTDATTPVANQLANLSSFFVISIAAIILQKALITVVGHISFAYLIPLACGLGIAYLIFKKEALRIIAIKLAMFGLIIFAAIPTSIAVAGGINDSYASSIEETAAAAASTAKKAEALSAPNEDKSGASGNILDQAKEALNGAVQSVTGAISGGLTAVEDIKNEAVASLNSFMERTALLIVTTCVIPVLTILTFAWLVKLFFGIDTRVGNTGRSLQSDVARSLRTAGRAVGDRVKTGTTTADRRED
jgi:hypothetical protein